MNIVMFDVQTTVWNSVWSQNVRVCWLHWQRTGNSVHHHSYIWKGKNFI